VILIAGNKDVANSLSTDFGCFVIVAPEWCRQPSFLLRKLSMFKEKIIFFPVAKKAHKGVDKSKLRG
jgi:hypothetical protein